MAAFAPARAALAEVAAHNPFSDAKGLGRAELEKLWATETAHQEDFLRKFRMEYLRAWRKDCGPAPTSAPHGR